MNQLPTDSKQPIIPYDWSRYYEQIGEHSAWYSGDVDELIRFYATTRTTPSANGRFWGENVNSKDRRTVVHTPLAGDIATFSADMLFSERPEVTIQEAHETDETGKVKPNTRARDAETRLEEIMDKGGVVNRLLEAGETTSALGGVFLKPTWDSSVLDVPILSIAQPDNAFPTFKHGILSGIIFHKVVKEEDTKVYRLLEHYRDGEIETALYLGDREYVGKKIGIDSISETEGTQEMLYTKIPGILARYIPNKRPHKRFRGTSMGMSDIQGSETLMDALDLTMTSWIRDISLGRGRIHVGDGMLNMQENGRASFDGGSEVYVELDIDPSMLGEGKSAMIATQFEIRTDEHYKTALELTARIIHMAGFSPQSFGINMDGGISTDSHEIRERKTLITKQKKERFFKSGLEDVLHMMLLIDNIHLNNSTPTEYRPNVTFADTLGHDIGSVSKTVQMLSQARSASIRTRVEMLHPDWTKDMIDTEVQTIREEEGLNVTNPLTMGGKEYDI